MSNVAIPLACDPTKSDVSTQSLLALGTLVGTLVFLTVKPITLPCVGCDVGGAFYRCMDGTGAGSFTCDAYKAGQDGISALKKSVMSSEEYGKELAKFASKLPQYLSEFAVTIKDQMVKLAAEIYARVRTIATYASKRLQEIALMLKKPLMNTWEAVYEEVIKPLITGFMKYIVAPVTDVLDSIIKFAKMIITEVGKLFKGGDKIIKASFDVVYQASGRTSRIIRSIMVESAHMIEQAIHGLETGLNVAMKEVVQGAEGAINDITGVIDDVVGEVESGVNKAVKKVTAITTDSVNKVGQGIEDMVSKTQEGVNSGLKEMTKFTEDSVNTVSKTAETSINVMGSSVVGGLGSVLSETENIVNKLSDTMQNSVNAAIGAINNDLSKPIEKAINGSGQIVEDAIGGILLPVQAIAKGVNAMSDWKMNISPFWVGRPFAFIGHAEVPGKVKIPRVSMGEIDKIDIPHCSIPNLVYNTKPRSKPVGVAPEVGRAKLNAAIRRAERNWKYAEDQSLYDDLYEANYPMATGYKNVGRLHQLGTTYTKDLSFMPSNEPLGASKATKFFRKAGKKIEKGFDKAGDELKKAAEKVYRETKEAALKAAEFAEKQAREAKELAEKVARETKALAEKVARETKELAEKVARETKELAEKAIEEAKKLVNMAIAAATKAMTEQERKYAEQAAREAEVARIAAAQALAAHAAALARYETAQAAHKLAIAQAKAEKDAKHASHKAAYTKPKKDIVVDGVQIDPISLKAPVINLKIPDLRIEEFKITELKLKKLNLKLNLTAPVLRFTPDNLGEKRMPPVPNLFDEIAEAGNTVKNILSGFFAPVWDAFGVLFTYINTVIVSIMRFFMEEVSWEKLRDGILSVLRQSKRGVDQMLDFIYQEIVLPFIAVVKWIGGELIILAKKFTKMALSFLGDLKKKVFELGESVWIKVKPILRETAVVGAGVIMYTAGTVLNYLPPFSWLPMNTTSKIYTCLSAFVILLLGAQFSFVSRQLLNLTNLALTPVMALDHILESYVSKHPQGISGSAARLLGFDFVYYKPPCWL